jgi:hypothetical protein
MKILYIDEMKDKFTWKISIAFANSKIKLQMQGSITNMIRSRHNIQVQQSRMIEIIVLK